MSNIRNGDLVRLRRPESLPPRLRHVAGALGRVACVIPRAGIFATIVTPEGPLEIRAPHGTVELVAKSPRT